MTRDRLARLHAEGGWVIPTLVATDHPAPQERTRHLPQNGSITNSPHRATARPRDRPPLTWRGQQAYKHCWTSARGPRISDNGSPGMEGKAVRNRCGPATVSEDETRQEGHWTGDGPGRRRA